MSSGCVCLRTQSFHPFAFSIIVLKIYTNLKILTWWVDGKNVIFLNFNGILLKTIRASDRNRVANIGFFWEPALYSKEFFSYAAIANLALIWLSFRRVFFRRTGTGNESEISWKKISSTKELFQIISQMWIPIIDKSFTEINLNTDPTVRY